ncbi:exonuclease domain-containing protein [Aestuariibacter sp. AA17]|uniref:Exonuclease domain-containing protein n=1 Tax=Fluctibacter corallii TaxID=2984329 RepID=A0ABT3AC77_9ALTE|nr:3'-5' exonuclease [Aestuariibacter sp. AA17]MCV2886270.1 exonuclease domain-containing protein [Aestuariibacter sp. AA17]
MITFVLFDTEFTAWPGSQNRNWSGDNEYKELIQIAAIKVGVSAHQPIKILSSFNELIKPQINPQLSPYIIELTGISQTMVDELGVDFASALSAFHGFAEQGQLACLSWGNDHHILLENCDYYGLTPPMFQTCLNVQAWAIKEALPCAQYCSGDLAKQLGVSMKGHAHNALFDVNSIARAMDVWLKSEALDYKRLMEWVNQ